jgi:hypothetical protein
MESVLLSLTFICLPIRPDLTSVLDLIGNRNRTYALVNNKGGQGSMWLLLPIVCMYFVLDVIIHHTVM